MIAKKFYFVCASAICLATITISCLVVSTAAFSWPRVSCCGNATQAIENLGGEIKQGAQSGVSAVEQVASQTVSSAERGVRDAQKARDKLAEAGQKIVEAARDDQAALAKAIVDVALKEASDALVRERNRLAAAAQVLAKCRDAIAQETLEVVAHVGGVATKLLVRAGESLSDATQRAQRGLSHLSTREWRELTHVELDIQKTREQLGHSSAELKTLHRMLASTPDVWSPAVVSRNMQRLDVTRILDRAARLDSATSISIPTPRLNVDMPPAVRTLSESLRAASLNAEGLRIDVSVDALGAGIRRARDGLVDTAYQAWEGTLIMAARFDEWRIKLMPHEHRCGGDLVTITDHLKEKACLDEEIKQLRWNHGLLAAKLNEMWEEVRSVVLEKVANLDATLQPLRFDSENEVAFSNRVEIARHGGLALMMSSNDVESSPGSAGTVFNGPGSEIRPGASRGPGSDNGNCHGASCPSSGSSHVSGIDGGGNAPTSPRVDSTPVRGNESGESHSGGRVERNSDDPFDDGDVASEAGDDGRSIEGRGGHSDGSGHGHHAFDDSGAPGSTRDIDVDELENPKDLLSYTPGRLASAVRIRRKIRDDILQKMDALNRAIDRHDNLVSKLEAKALDEISPEDWTNLNDFGVQRSADLWSIKMDAQQRVFETLHRGKNWARTLAESSRAILGDDVLQAVASENMSPLVFDRLQAVDNGSSTFFSHAGESLFRRGAFDPAFVSGDRSAMLASIYMWTTSLHLYGSDYLRHDSLARRLDYITAIYRTGMRVGDAFSNPNTASGQVGGGGSFEAEIESVATYRDLVVKVIEQGHLDHQDQRLAYVEIADGAIAGARVAHAEDDPSRREELKRFAVALLDSALSFTPGVGWAKDIYEAVTNKNFVSGEKLDTWGHYFAIAGAVTGGLGSKLKIVSKRLEAIAETAKLTGRPGGEVRGALDAVAEAAAAARKAGIAEHQTKRFLEFVGLFKGSSHMSVDALADLFKQAHSISDAEKAKIIARVERHSHGWESVQFSEFYKKFAGENPSISVNPNSGKILYYNASTGIEVAHDLHGGYLRIRDTGLQVEKSEFEYLNKDGLLVLTKTLPDGRVFNLNKNEYESSTHFKIERL